MRVSINRAFKSDMEQIYKPSRSNLKSAIIISFVLWFLTLAIGLTSSGVIWNKIVGTVGFTLLFILFPLVIVFTYTSIDEETIKIVRALVFRKTIMISKVESLQADPAFGGLVIGVQIKYQDASGQPKETSLGTIQLYGKTTTNEIVRTLCDANASITVDPQIKKIL